MPENRVFDKDPYNGWKYSILILFFSKQEKRAVMGHLHLDGSDKDEIDEDGLGASLINNRCKLHEFFKGDGLVFVEIMQQGHFWFSERDFGELGVFLIFPNFE